MQLHFKSITAHDESVCISNQTYHAFSEHILEQKASNEGKRMTLRMTLNELFFLHEQFNLHVFGGGKKHTLMMNRC